MLYGMICHGSDWDLQTKLSFAVELATCKVQLDGFDGLADKAPFPREARRDRDRRSVDACSDAA